MTIQLELDFVASYADLACLDLRAFAVSASTLLFREHYLPRFKALQRQANDLKNFAFLHDFIDGDEYSRLSNSIIESSDIFWS